MDECLPTEYAEQITIKDYLNSLEILKEITENDGLGKFRYVI